jgi:hypothetical protein
MSIETAHKKEAFLEIMLILPKNRDDTVHSDSEMGSPLYTEIPFYGYSSPAVSRSWSK